VRHRTWDAFLDVPDPDALAAEFASRGVQFFTPLGDNSDGLRGFEVQDADGYMLLFRSPDLAANAEQSRLRKE
jgi:hypothetical protein